MENKVGKKAQINDLEKYFLAAIWAVCCLYFTGMPTLQLHIYEKWHDSNILYRIEYAVSNPSYGKKDKKYSPIIECVIGIADRGV